MAPHESELTESSRYTQHNPCTDNQCHARPRPRQCGFQKAPFTVSTRTGQQPGANSRDECVDDKNPDQEDLVRVRNTG
jgi:hypothetical protein